MLPTTSLSRFWNLSPGSLSSIREEFQSALNSISSSANCRGQFPMTIWENETGVRLSLDVPGFSEDELSVEVENSVLTISGTRKPPESDDTVTHREQRFGEFSRSIKLGDTLNAGSVDAELESGVLTLQIPKKPEALPTKVSIALKKSDKP